MIAQRESDLDLIEKYRRTGETAYLNDLYRRYLHLVYGVCLRIIKDPHRSEDACMEVFERVTTLLKDQDVRSFQNWLYFVTRNYCYKLVQQPILDLLSSEELEQKTGVSFVEKEREETQIKEAMYEDLEAGIAQLPEEQRLCVVLFYYQRQSYREIAQTTGQDEKWVKTHLQNGKRKLKILLDKNLHGA